MGKKIYLSQIQAKIALLERERNQVLKHLSIVEDKIQTLNAALEIMQTHALTNEYSTKLYAYRTYKRRFHGKIRQIVLEIMKNESERSFTIKELAKLALIKDKQESDPTHFNRALRFKTLAKEKHCRKIND